MITKVSTGGVQVQETCCYDGAENTLLIEHSRVLRTAMISPSTYMRKI